MFLHESERLVYQQQIDALECEAEYWRFARHEVFSASASKYFMPMIVVLLGTLLWVLLG
jgi:hypothetical protein